MASEAYNKALEIDKSNNIAITKLSMITQLFNYHPNTKNTEIQHQPFNYSDVYEYY